MDRPPRFKVNDEVRWPPSLGKITLGPYAPGVKLAGGHAMYDDYTYVVRVGEAVFMLEDHVLAPLPNWVACPGKHRPVGPVCDVWERLEP
jgi:hypothetical protein